MEDSQKYIAKLEDDARRLVDELGALKKEVVSYKEATGELTQARTALTVFLDKTKALTDVTYKLLGTMSEIGSGRIFEELKSIRETAEGNARMGIVIKRLVLAGVLVIAGLQCVILVKIQGMK